MSAENYRIIVDSLGTARGGLVHVIKKVSPLSENRIAALLFRAPAELLSHLPYEIAHDVCDLLQSAGLECQVADSSYTFTPGDDNHEVALVIRDFRRITEVLEQIVLLLGVDLDTARKIVCTSPTVLLGGISHNTVLAVQRRFASLGVEVDVSQPSAAQFDLFVGQCSALERQHLIRLFRDYNIPVPENLGPDQQLIITELKRSQADHIWERLQRTAYPVRIINRDFERFDLRLDQAPASSEMIAYLMESTGMPEKVAGMVPGKTPLILQQNIRFADMVQHLDQITKLGGQASGHLLAFQSFSVALEKLGDPTATRSLIRFIGGSTEAQVAEALQTSQVPGPLSQPQARWLQTELKRVGTESRLVLL